MSTIAQKGGWYLWTLSISISKGFLVNLKVVWRFLKKYQGWKVCILDEINTYSINECTYWTINTSYKWLKIKCLLINEFEKLLQTEQLYRFDSTHTHFVRQTFNEIVIMMGILSKNTIKDAAWTTLTKGDENFVQNFFFWWSDKVVSLLCSFDIILLDFNDIDVFIHCYENS